MVIKTGCATAVVLAVMVGMACNSRADVPPLVYTNEFTGAGYAVPTLPPVAVAGDIASFPTVLPLPDPFTWISDPFNVGGTRSTNFNDWPNHRAEFKAMLQAYEIGYKPYVDPTNIFASFSGSTLTVWVTNSVAGTNRTLRLQCAVSFPAGGSGAYPAIIGMNSPNGSISLGGRRIATITYSHDQVTTYNNPQNSNPYYIMYAAPYSPALNVDNTGQYSAWAWGVSRIIDGLYKLNGTLGANQINLQRLGVTGCSYAGKMALFCGAFDERIALTIPQESGGGGAPNWRYSWQNEPNGNVEGLGQTSHQWFSENMFIFAGANTAKLPHDHHELLAMVAPRALFATGNPDGAVWLSNPSCYISCKAVERVYDTFGIGDRFGYNINGGKSHCATTTDLNNDVTAFLDKFLLGTNTINTITNRHVPAAYSSINFVRWTSWWGTTNPAFPYQGRLTLSLPTNTPIEGVGTLVGQGIINVTPAPLNDQVIINLSSSNTNKITVPASVIIPIGQTNAVFDLNIIDNPLLDGSQVVTITGSSEVFTNGPQNKQMTVQDNETAGLSVTLPASASESAGGSVQGTVSIIGGIAGANVPISLTSSDPSLFQLGTVFIPKGQTSAVFLTYIVDKGIIGGSQSVNVTARVANWTNGFTSMTILFDNPLPSSLRFAWNPIPSPQVIGEPFPVTITALDDANNPLDFRLPVTLSALIPGNATGTNSILNSPSLDQSLTAGGEYVRGYSFTPSANLKVTHVRHYFGDKVSIWTATGQLLASQNVVSTPGTWVDTALPTPLILPANATYLIVGHVNSDQCFWGQSLPATFPDGTISQSWWDYGDTFPTQTDSAQWYFVDLLYAKDFVSVPVTPGTTPDFVTGVWSGNVAATQAGTNLVLQASTGGRSGGSNPFTVVGTPKLAITTLNNSVVLSWPVGAAGFVLQQGSTLSNWTDVVVTPSVVGDRNNITNALGVGPNFFRLRKP